MYSEENRHHQFLIESFQLALRRYPNLEVKRDKLGNFLFQRKINDRECIRLDIYDLDFPSESLVDLLLRESKFPVLKLRFHHERLKEDEKNWELLGRAVYTIFVQHISHPVFTYQESSASGFPLAFESAQNLMQEGERIFSQFLSLPDKLKHLFTAQVQDDHGEVTIFTEGADILPIYGYPLLQFLAQLTKPRLQHQLVRALIQQGSISES